MENKFGNINIRKEFNVEKDPLVYEAIKMVEKMLKDRPDFVSVTPMGSKYRGYSKESSDIDLLALFDTSGELELKNSWITINDERVIPRHLFLKGKQIEVHHFNINMDNINENFKKDYFPFLARCFQGIFSVSSNKKIKEYRDKIKQIFLEKVPENERADFVKHIANQIANVELYSGSKMFERIPGFTYKKGKEKIRNFWNRRLSYFLLKDE